MKKIVLIILILAVIIFSGWNLFSKKNQRSELEKIRLNYPSLELYVDGVIRSKTILEKDKDDIVAYNSLGLAWKSLADWSQKEGVENYKDYYKEALEIYEAGIDKTFRKNTLFMTNAGNMAKYLEDYKLAESYYEEAISVSPGDESYYVLLAELYEYNMNKSEEEIIAVYEAGKKRVLNPLFLEQRKRSFINRFNN